MKIAVIGMGNVGSVLGRRWAAGGHEVVFGVRDVTKPEAVVKAKTAAAGLATIAEAVAGAEVVVLAVPWDAALTTVKSSGDLSGKILLDCTNPLSPDLSNLVIGTTTSAGEQIGEAALGAKVVKIFNTTGAPNMNNPQGMTMLYAGDDVHANTVAHTLAAELGFTPVVVGPLSASRLLEPFALVWITLAIRQNLGFRFALNVVPLNEA